MTRGAFEDLTGRRFGRRVALERAEPPTPGDPNTHYLARCDCGAEPKVVRAETLKRTTRCRACWSKEITGRDMTGEPYGSLVVIERVSRSNGNKSARWRVRCGCGAERVMCSENIRRAKSCAACVRFKPKVTRLLVEILILAAEHPSVSPSLMVDELGITPSSAYGALRQATTRKRIAHTAKGTYALAPDGLALLREIAEGRRADRWKLRDEIVAALDGSRASGCSTLRQGGKRAA